MGMFSIRKWELFSSHWSIKVHMIMGCVSFKHPTWLITVQMSKLNKLGPWYLRFLTIDKETGVLSYLTSNGVGKVVTVESKTEPPKQTVRLDIISVCNIDRVPTTVVCCACRREKGLLHNHTRSGLNVPPRFSAGSRQQQGYTFWRALWMVSWICAYRYWHWQ